MNSILHILQQLPDFAKYIYNYNNNNNNNNNIIYQLHLLFKNSLDNNDAVIIPTSFKKIIGDKNNMWNEFNHQDSQEFLIFLLSELEKELGLNYEIIYGTFFNNNYNENLIINNILNENNIYNNLFLLNTYIYEHKIFSKEYSIISQIFNGIIENSKKCKCCFTITFRYEEFITLSLTIPIKNNYDNNQYTLYDCLDNLINETQLDNDNLILCDFCGLSNKSFTKSLIWKPPKILILHIKRFITNNYGMITNKLTNNINYPIELNIEKYINIYSPYKNNHNYTLVGINIHNSLGSNNNINAGHYISYVKNIINNNWYIYNDEYPIIHIKNLNNLQNSNSYLLFYLLK
jgi:ubiquitin C-terminal hydrolase